MRRFAFAGLLVVALLGVSVVVQEVGAHTRSEESSTAGSQFVGSWRVVVTTADGNSFPVLSTYMADGTTVHSGPVAQPAVPGAPYSVQFSTIGQGVWEVTGSDTSALTFEVMMSDEHGALLGRQTIQGVQQLEPGGDSFTGQYVLTVTDPAGNVVATIPTTARAERLVVEVPQSLGAQEATPAS